MSSNWMIYGANGYTGRLIAEAAIERGLRPVLAGRSAQAVQALGDRLGLPTRVFPVDTAENVAHHLEGMRCVLHCAGPFLRTFQPMLEACKQVGAHYLDITGELDVFEAIYAQDASLRAAGILAVPGVGADVVPTDCLAALLHRELPDATWLRLSVSSPEALSAGTVKSMLEMLGKGGAVRLNGQLVREPLAQRTMRVPLGDRPVPAMSIPLADVTSGYRSTGIPNIVCFGPAPAGAEVALRLAQLAGPLLGLLKGPIDQAVGLLVHGPSETQRTTGKAVWWGEVENAAGQKVSLRLHTPEPYALTVLTALAAAERALQPDVTPGARTPSQAFGAEFVTRLPGVTLERL